MLRVLTVENLLLIERAELEFAPGLNALTGETGAGKTLLATGLGLLLGDRSRSGLVRPGAGEAFVEGVFDVPPELPEHLAALVPEQCEELILVRRVWPDGRSRAQICGRTATVGDLRDLAASMISFHGQHEHRRLTLAGFQLEVLDAACGPDQPERRNRARTAHDAVVEAERHLERLSGGSAGGQRELDLLRWELDEIEAVAPLPDELTGLQEERNRLRSSDRIREALQGALQALSPDDGGQGARELLAASSKEIGVTAGGAGRLAEIAERLESVIAELDDVAADARAELDLLDASPERLAEVEHRLDEIAHLERKYGGSVETVLAHADSCRKRLAEMNDLEGAIDAAERALESARDEQRDAASSLSKARRAAAGPLAAQVEAELADLALDGARFGIELSDRDEIGATGSDRVEFMVAANPGLDPSPLGQTASGGEISRVLLALLSVSYANGGGGDRLLVFDEIDAGVGGRTAVAVGKRLNSLARTAQILAITHLAPVAAQAERHFTIEKRGTAGGSTTVVEQLEGDRLLEEMVRMLGAAEGDSAARAHAAELLSGAARTDAG